MRNDTTAAPPRYEDLPDLVSPADVQRFLQISRNSVYTLLASGAIPSLRFGRLIRVPKSALIESGTDRRHGSVHPARRAS